MCFTPVEGRWQWQRLFDTPPLALLMPCVACLAVLACGGCGAGDSSITQIKGSSAEITKPMLDHWMRAVVATDFFVSIGAKAPRGLASEPANPSECARAARKIIPRTSTGEPKLSDPEITRKCSLLHEAIMRQAMSYLLSAQWVMLEAKELGVSLSPEELHMELLRYIKDTFRTQAKFQQYMQESQLALSDVLYQLQRNVLVTRLLPKFQARVRQAGGGQTTFYKLAMARYRGRIAKTSCRAGYVMEDCNEYHLSAKPLPSPNAILEAFVRGSPTNQ